jgi:hypothetical protein
MKPLEFPNRAEDIGPSLLTAVLEERHPGVCVEKVTVLDQAHCDSGSASTAARAVLELAFGGGGENLPARMILKTVLVRPGSIADLYENEVRFYRELRDEVEIETPRFFGGTFDASSGSFGILMEDVTLRGARFPNALDAMNLYQMRDLLGGLAAMHARFWQSPRFTTDLTWMWTPLSGGFYDFLQSSAGLEFFRGLMVQCEYKVELLRRLGKSLEQMWELLWKAQALLAKEPVTLLHGDTHFGNTYLLPGNRVGMLDWQLVNRGRWAHDVTYMLMTALDVETRRSHDRDLLGYYLEKLRAGGVTDAPSLDDAWELYRRTAIWGFMLGWFICPVENYGEEILRANLERLATTLEDLETFTALAD